MLKRFIIAILGLGIVFGGLAWFNFVYKPSLFPKNFTPPPATISAAPAKAETWQPSLSAVGTLRAINGVEIAPEVPGIVRRISFESGEDVTAGTLLIELDTAVEEAELKSNEAKLADTKLRYQRGAELLKRGNFAKAQLDSIEAERDQAAAEVERARVRIGQKNIRAPFDGRLGIRQVDLGEYLSAGTTIVTLQALDPIYVDFPLPERELAKVAVGQPVQVTVDAFPEKKFDGTISSIDARVNQETRNFLVRAILPNPARELLPGMFGNVQVRLPQQIGVVAVPQTAVTYAPYGDTVFVLSKEPVETDPDGQPVFTVESRIVRLGERQGDEIAVAAGLAAGETVVTSGQIKLQNGARVKVDNSIELAPRPELPLE